MFEWFTKRKKIEELFDEVSHWHNKYYDARQTILHQATELEDTKSRLRSTTCLAEELNSDIKKLESENRELRNEHKDTLEKYKKLFKRIDSEGWYNRVNPKYIFDNVSTIYSEKPTKEDKVGIRIEVPQKRVALKFDIDPKMLDIYLDYVLEDVEDGFKNMFLNEVLPQFIDRIREANKK